MIRLRLGRICDGNLKQLLGDNAKALWAGFTTAMQQEESYTNSTVGNTVPKELKYLPSWFPKKVRPVWAFSEHHWCKLELSSLLHAIASCCMR